VLEEGDEITINYGMIVGGDPNNRPEIENMVEGIGLVMLDGQLTNNNYDDYNSKVYSRTGYGASADGKRLILIVIDNSQSKKYGRSQGCSTETMCHILKSLCPYVSNVNSMDAGGSAMMIVDGECINNTIEGNPRTVACGWMVEAFGEEDYEIASIAFDDWKIESPTYSSYTPRILGYNKLGELIDKDVKGFTLSCDEALGATQGDTFIAGSESMQGTLTATLNGMTATLPVTTIIAQPTIKIKPNLLIDNRSYPIEVIANVGDKTYTYDSSKFNWSVDDETIAGITDGVLKAVKNGKTRFECAIGPYVESDSLTVEISDTPYIYQPWDDAWTIKGSGAKNFTLGEDGTLNYTYSGSRAPYISLKKDLTFYSLPDTIALTFNSSLPIEYIQIDMRNAAFSSVNYMKYEIEGGFLAGQDYTVKVDLGALGGTRDISTYPLYLKEIKIVPDKSLATNGEHTLALKSLYSHYRDMDAPLLGDVNGDGEIDVKDVTALITYILGDIPEDFVIENANVNGEGEIDVQDVTAIINIILR
ncbi:MAG: phosphodiester glycosidase family protein, partial [Muribaculaceae bacterium]|nr:phosphodiester glycosidase family protein [Muribaculaceae bacterium]